MFNDNETQLDGDEANNISISYSYSQTTSYVYDNTLKLYKRFIKGKPHIDKQIDAQLSAKNIIVQFARHHSIDQEDRQDIELVGSGMGFYITNGKYVNITWKKTSRTSKTIYYDDNGNEIKLNKGQTWIQIVPLTSKVSITK